MKKEKKLCPYEILMIIINSQFEEQMESFLRQNCKQNPIVLMAKGTSQTQTDDLFSFGLEDRHMFALFIDKNETASVIENIAKNFENQDCQVGVIFTLQVDGISSNLLSSIVEKENIMKSDENKKALKQEESQYELIVSIINRGYADYVVESAKEVGASGATILYARGSTKDDDSVFGISLQPEKEMVLIVTPKKSKKAMMKEIIENTALTAKGNGICFSMPVSDAYFIDYTKKNKKS